MKHHDILTQKMRLFDKKYECYRENEKTLVGFSGGADSVALLYALCSLLGKERIVALHVNHMLRGNESERDEAFCRAFCAAHEISFVCKRADVLSLSGGISLEETARRVRYEFLEETAKEQDCTTVSLAHHAGDNLETMLFHLCRGTGLAGLAGIPPTRPLGNIRIVRPMLDCTREEILGYLAQNNLSYVTDSTNTDTHYTRNFIRHEIIPKLKEINPQAEENARKTAEIAQNAASHLTNEARTFLSEKKTAENADMLRALSPALLYSVLSELYQNAGGETLSAVQSAAVIDLLYHKEKGHSVSLTGSIKAHLDGKMLRFSSETKEKQNPLKEKFALQTGENRLQNDILVFVDKAPDAKLLESAVFYAKTKIPMQSLETLHLRARENGESYRFGGMTRKFKKLLSGADSVMKNRPLLCDADGILWHPNFPIADRAKENPEILIWYLEH
jgi:tRNA(Ile)-lysidine synthase